MKKEIYILFLVLLSQVSIAQVRNIYLIKETDTIRTFLDTSYNNKYVGEVYRFKNSNDTNYYWTYNILDMDMGAIAIWCSYRAKENIADGIYNIYINDIFTEKITYKNGIKNGYHFSVLWNDTSTFQIDNFINDQLSESFTINDSGQLLKYRIYNTSEPKVTCSGWKKR